MSTEPFSASMIKKKKKKKRRHFNHLPLGFLWLVLDILLNLYVQCLLNSNRVYFNFKEHWTSAAKMPQKTKEIA